MLSRTLQLVCSLLAISVIHSTNGQATATGSENGIVSAAGGPQETSSVTYSIQGEGVAATTASSSNSVVSVSSAPTADTTSGTVLDGSESKLTDGSDRGLSTAAILGVVVAVVLAIVVIIIISIILHRRRSRAAGAARAAKRKSIMDIEFSPSKVDLEKTITQTSRPSDDKPSLGYFDLAKPLPVVTTERVIEDDRLSRSSTIIAADAAEVAQINRKASVHQTKHKKSREHQRERNHALQILITNEDNRTSRYSIPQSPYASSSSSPVEPDSARCPDGDGDAFTKRPSKL